MAHKHRICKNTRAPQGTALGQSNTHTRTALGQPTSQPNHISVESVLNG